MTPKPKKSTTPRKQFNLRLTLETYALLEQIKERDGTPFAVQIDRAIWLFAKQRGIDVPERQARRA